MAGSASSANDVVRPGSYSVSGLATITNALYASGGVKPIGSLRNIALRRDGNTVATLDLYEFLLRGDTRSDIRIQPGDAIFVPPIGPTVAVSGAFGSGAGSHRRAPHAGLNELRQSSSVVLLRTGVVVGTVVATTGDAVVVVVGVVVVVVIASPPADTVRGRDRPAGRADKAPTAAQTATATASAPGKSLGTARVPPFTPL